MHHPAVAAAALAVSLISGCGHPVAVGGGHPTATNCRASPPDVMGSIQSVIAGGGGTHYSSDIETKAWQAYRSAHEDVWAGIASGGTHVYAGFTADAQLHLAELRRLVPEAEVYRAYCAPFSQRQEETVQNRIMEDKAKLKNEGIEVTGVGVGTPDGLVDVTVLHLAPNTQARLHGLYGDLVSVTEGGYGIAN
jgi:hypothetical protein